MNINMDILILTIHVNELSQQLLTQNKHFHQDKYLHMESQLIKDVRFEPVKYGILAS